MVRTTRRRLFANTTAKRIAAGTAKPRGAPAIRADLSALLRDAIAVVFRRLRHVRGRSRVGAGIQRFLTPRGTRSNLVRCRLGDGSRMILDLRSTIEARAYWTGTYERDVFLLRRALRASFVVLDIGAHIGFYAVPLARRLRELGGGLVFAFEPVPANAVRLRENVAANGLEGVVITVELALGAAKRSVVLKPDPSSEADTRNAFVTDDRVLRPDRVRARMSTLDVVAPQIGIERCDVVKIDVEGSELDVLKGGRDLLSTYRPIVMLELNPHRMAQFGWTADDLAAVASDLGYTAWRRVGRHSTPLVTEPLDLENAFLVPRGSRPPR